MTARVLFVSVRQSFDPSDPSSSVAQLEPWVERAWCIGVEKAATCDRVVAVQVGAPLAAWRIRDAFPTDETYNVGGTTRRRVGLSLGDPLPILAAYSVVPALRHGVAIAVCPVEPLPIERQARAAPVVAEPELTPERGGPVAFVHPAYAYRLPEYVAARDAIDRLVKALAKAVPNTAALPQEAWVAMVADFARSNPYADCCSVCQDSDRHDSTSPRFPFKVVMDDQAWFTGTYFCNVCGHEWTGGWSVDAPLLFL